MTKTEGQNPGILSAEPIRVVHFKDIIAMGLKPKDKISGVVSLEDLNTLADLIAVKVSGRSFRMRNPGQSVTSSQNMEILSNHYKKIAERQRMLGPIQDFEVVVLASEDKSVAFEAEGSLYSTGRGKVGSIKCVNTIFVRPDGNPAFSSNFLNEQELRADLRRVAPSLAASRSDYVVRARRVL